MSAVRLAVATTAALVAAATASTIVTPPRPAAVPTLIAPGLSHGPSTETAIRTIAQKYSIEIEWHSGYAETASESKVTSHKPSEIEVNGFAPDLAAVLAMYPPKLFESGKLKRVVLGTGVRRGKENLGGLAIVSEQTLLLDVGVPRDAEWQRRGFHHELFHLIDPIDDEAWSKLNQQEFAYREMTAAEARRPNKMPGFLSTTSRTNAAEDRAELFSYLMMDPKAVTKKAGNDDLLREKVAFLEEKISSEGLDGDFWDSIATAKAKAAAAANKRPPGALVVPPPIVSPVPTVAPQVLQIRR